MAVAVNDKSIDAQTINGAINGISRETDKKSLYTRRVCVGMETWQWQAYACVDKALVIRATTTTATEKSFWLQGSG